MIDHFREKLILLSEGHFSPTTLISELRAQTHFKTSKPEILVTFSWASPITEVILMNLSKKPGGYFFYISPWLLRLLKGRLAL